MRRSLTTKEIAEVQRLYGNGDGLTYDDLAKRFQVSPSQIGYVIKPEKRLGQGSHTKRDRQRENKRSQQKQARISKEAAATKRAAHLPPVEGHRIREEELLKRLRAMPRDTRGKTESFCGDPLPGESALDRKSSPDGLTARERAAGFKEHYSHQGRRESEWHL